MIVAGPVGCVMGLHSKQAEWSDVLDIRISRYQIPLYGKLTWVEHCASVRLLPGVTYVTVSPVTGEIRELGPFKTTAKEVQLNLF